MTRPPHILYVAPQLPKRSETFVYRELFALRRGGLAVSAASLHAPERGLDDEALERLAGEAICLYGGPVRLLGAMAAEALIHPVSTASTLLRAARDAAVARDIRGAARVKVLWHGAVGLALARRARAIGATHLHAHFAHVSASLAMYAAHQLGCGFSFTGHAADLFRDRCLLTQKLERATFVSCISHWHRAYYQSLVARPDAAYPVVRCGVDPAEFTPTAAEGVRASPRIVAVGRLVPKKGFDLLLSALADVRNAGVPFACRILGDGPERGALAEQISDLGLGGGVALEGAASNSAVRAALGKAELFVLPCRQGSDGDRDGIPVALMEAMACGVCAVSGDLPTIRELIDDGENGYLVPPEDAAALSGTLERLLRNPEERCATAAAGRRRIETEFSLELNSLRLRDAFAKLGT